VADTDFHRRRIQDTIEKPFLPRNPNAMLDFTKDPNMKTLNQKAKKSFGH